MQTPELLDKLFQECGQLLGDVDIVSVPGVQAYEVVFADDFVVAGQYEEERGLLQLSSYLGVPPEESNSTLHSLLLSVNQYTADTGGITFSMDGDDNSIYLHYVVALSVLDAQTLQQAIAQFAEHINGWREVVARGGKQPSGEHGPTRPANLFV